VSVGHPYTTAGTIGCRVTDGRGVFGLLSNTHVLAPPDGPAKLGDPILQPGPYDGGLYWRDQIGKLYDFARINFSGGNNLIDAAVAITSLEDLGKSTLPDGYGEPSRIVVQEPSVGLSVKKHGRSTELTQGTISAINVTVNVCYDIYCQNVGRFTDQLMISPAGFSAGGDSGSLIVTESGGNRPVGLLFAGSSTSTFANEITKVLSFFNLSIDGRTGTFVPTDSLTTPRHDHSQTLVDETHILVCGGWGGTELRSCELFHTDTKRFSPTGSMILPRSGHAAVRLATDKILIVEEEPFQGSPKYTIRSRAFFHPPRPPSGGKIWPECIFASLRGGSYLRGTGTWWTGTS